MSARLVSICRTGRNMAKDGTFSCLQEAALAVLRTADADAKAKITFAVAEKFFEGAIPIDDPLARGTKWEELAPHGGLQTRALRLAGHPCVEAPTMETAGTQEPVSATHTSPSDTKTMDLVSTEALWVVPAVPARPNYVTMVDPRKTPGSKTLKSLVHSLTHAESYAIDLSWDILVRFGYSPLSWDYNTAIKAATPPIADGGAQRMPDEFFRDWVKVAAEEAKHFSGWRDKLITMGCKYGDILAHDGLWESALDTGHSLMARLAVVHMVHEARGLDTYPMTFERFRKAGDTAALSTIEVNHAEEITHVAAGRRWLQYLCDKEGMDPIPVYHQLVRSYFCGTLKPPFNTRSRDLAGLGEDWYAALVAAGPGKEGPELEER